MHVGQAKIKYVKKTQSSKEAWDKLKEHFVSDRPAQKSSIIKRLVRFKYDESVDMEAFLMDYTSTVEQLTELGIIIPDEVLVILLLASLPDDFEHFVTAIETRDELPLLALLRIKLLDETNRRKEKNAEEASNKAFVSKSQKKNFLKKKNNKGCYICGSTKHWKNKCDKKKEESTDKKKNNSSSGAFCALAKCNTNPKTWFIDSGASQHMTPYKELLHNVRPSNSLPIKSANNATLAVEQEGDSTLRIGNNEIEVSNVLYVSDLSFNLLSVHKIAEKGNSITFNQNGCTISNSSNKINSKARNGVYEVNESECVSLFTNNNADTYTWHRRLGHLSFGKMLDLQKWKVL